MRRNTCLAATVVLLALCLPLWAGADESRATATLQGDSARPAAASWLRSELYFGIGLLEAPAGTAPRVSDADWQDFLDREVTPRFPDGLTVFDAYGQWLNRHKDKPSRLRTKVLVILHEDTPEKRAAIDAIRAAWKARWHDQSVLLVTQRVDVSF